MKWIALAMFLAGAAASVAAAAWANERGPSLDEGFTPWLALLLAGLASTVAGAAWLFVLGFSALP
jgi:hypothetical protein